MARPIVYVCMSGDCQARKGPLRKLLALLEGRTRAEVVSCQKICEGPVCGLELDGTLEWFERLDTPKSRGALRLLLDEGRMTKPLKKRRVAERRGKLRD